MLLAVLLLAQAARAQYEAKTGDGVDVLTTPMEGEACGYESCLPIQPGWLNVHLVPQTHSELGHGYTFHQHFTGEDPPFPKNTINMKRILDSILTELWNNDRRRFTLSDTAYLFHWWKNRHPSVHRMMYELIRQGRLTIVGGGLGVSDEASTSYHAIIDQYTYSLRKLNATFRACARPLVAWAVDVYGHSKEFTSLMAQMGFDALFINPISYDEEVARMRRKSLEFLWRGSDDLGPATDMFTHNLFDGYWAPPGFCFSKLCSDPLLVTSSKLFSDIRDRVDKFIEGVLYRQAPNYETRNVMMIMGHRKAYSDADVWFANIEKLIAFTNWRASQKQLNITLFYSNPPCYLAAVHDENPELETKQDDFFPYVHDKDSYTVGMYSSRPTFKYFIREAHVYLQIAKQMQVTANMGPYTNLFEDFKWVMGVVQDHSIAPGVLRERVKEYYTSRIDTAVTNATEFISKAFTKLRSSPNHVVYLRCQFNISSCYGSRYIKYSVQVYNPLGWPVTMPVRLPVYPTNSQFNVYNHNGEEVKSATIKLPDTILRIKDRPKADYELVFVATDIPPVGFRSYYVEAQFYKGKILSRSTEDYEQDYEEETTMSSIRKESVKESRLSNNKYGIKVLGIDANKRRKKMIETIRRNNTHDTQNITFKADTNEPEMPVAEILEGPANNYMRNTIQIDDEQIVTTEGQILLPMIREFTTEAGVLLPMLKDYLQKSKVLHKLDFVDTEKEFLSSNELKAAEFEHTTETELENTDTIEPDIKITFKKNTSIKDVMVDSDIRVPTRRPSKGSNIQFLNRGKPKQLNLGMHFGTTTEPDIIVVTPVRNEDILINSDIEVPIHKGTIKTKPNGKELKSVELEQARTESLAIVPVKTDAGASTVRAVDSSTESVLEVVPVRKTWEKIYQNIKLGTKRSGAGTKHNEENNAVTQSVKPEPSTTLERQQTNEIPVYKAEASRISEPVAENDFIVDTGARNEDLEQIENSERFRTFSLTTEVVEPMGNRRYSQNEVIEGMSVAERSRNDSLMTEEVEATTGSYYLSSATDRLNATDDKLLAGSPVVTRTTTFAAPSDEKYFKVDDGSPLFIGNKYVRINLDQRRRISSVFLRNGVRTNLNIIPFHYVSDDPSRFDIRTVPRRDIKPPGAYIFRPIDPYIVRTEDNYDVRIVKTDVVEEIHMTFSNWTSLQLRLYVDSPVIEVHWLVGPIPTDDGLGKEVFIRYQTDLEHDGAFYTDSNGRQTIKRIKGTRATYEPVDLDPITGNLYPVTSKIHIEDSRRNVRFAVFNDRCQAGGALIDGAIDLMVHRRILTDDIGFGAYLNETENNEPIRAAGTHYLYLTKADRNRIFEKKFAKEIALAPRVLISHNLMYTDDMRKQFYNSKNEFSAIKEKLPLGIHLLSLERITAEEILVRLENYLEKVDVTSDGVRYVRLRDLFANIRIVWLKETTLAGNLYKDQWTPTRWRKKNKFYRRFNDYYGGVNDTLEEVTETVADELGGRGIRLAPQQIRTFIVKYKYIKV